MGLFGKKAPEVLDELQYRSYGAELPHDHARERMQVISKLKIGDDLIFKPAPTKDFPNNIGVFTKKGAEIGFLHYTTVNALKKYGNRNMSVTVKSIDKSEHGYTVLMKILIYK